MTTNQQLELGFNGIPARPLGRRSTRAARGKWWFAQIRAAVANAMDVHSSWGKHELNSNLSSANGTFGKQGALLKLGIQGGLFGVEYLISRGHPTGKMFRALAIVNFGATAATAATAAHNYTIGR